ncbi:MAG: RimK family alpha-L-glutamate ligase [Methylophilaceae bacterium]
MKQVVIFTDEVEQKGGWHGLQLIQAFAERGVDAVFASLQDCVIDLSGNKPQIHIPNFNGNLKAAFVRGIAGGTLQQIITRLNVLHMLEMQGVTVYNSGKAIERTVDKTMTSFLLNLANIASPPTWVCESRSHAHNIMHNQLQKTKLVIKPLFGSQGHGVRLLEYSSKYPLPMDDFVDGVFYLQHFVDSGTNSHDFRVLVVNNQAVAAMRRTGVTWVNNVAQGAQCEQINDKDILTLAEQAAKVLEIDYCGVDIIRDKAGKLLVLEVNSIPAWYGLENSTNIKINHILTDYLLSKLS